MSELVLEDRHKTLPDHALNQLFRGARTFYTWEDKDVSDTTLEALYDLLKYGPTSANKLACALCLPQRRRQKSGSSPS